MALRKGIRGFVRGLPPGASDGSMQGSIEDRVRQLHRVTPVVSPRPEVRLNLLVPTVDAGRTYGGIRTALDLFEAMGTVVGERRIVAVSRGSSTAGDVIPAYASIEGGVDPPLPLQSVDVSRPGSELAVRRGDVFVATYWTTAELVGRIRRWQAATYGRAPERFAYLIQDFEPGFYPWSAQWLLARATYARPDETTAIFNTSMLRDYFHASDIRFGQEHAFEPRMLPELRAAMAAPPVPRTRTILIYGRPGTPRNAFPAIVDGLRAWRVRHPNADDWQVVSIGRAHPDIFLGDGATLRSVGKLDLEAYARLLRQAAVGVSMMVSPHPSYPPLEMAHLGMQVLTNRFGPKDLSTWHSNIRTTEDVSAEEIAALLSAMCQAFERDPDIGTRGTPLRTDFTTDLPAFPFAAQVADGLLAGVTLPSTVGGAVRYGEAGP